MAESHPSFSGDKRNVGEIQPADSTANTAINTENSDSVLVSEYSQADYHSSYDIIFDLIHTKLAVRFDWEKQHLMGKAEIDLKAHFYPQNVLVLDAKGFDVNSVALLDGKKSSLLQFKYDQKKLTIELGRFYTRDQRLKIAIDYVAKPNELPKPENVGSAITDDKGLYFINPLGDKEEPQQIWTQGETESASCWFPTIDSPNQKTTQEIAITVEKKFLSLSNGQMVSSVQNADGTRTDTWKQNKPHAPYLMMMAIGNFVIIKDKWRNVPLEYYVEPEYAASAKAIFGKTPQMIDAFSKLFGVDFVWDKFAQIPVREYVSGAMENTGAVIFGDFIQKTKRQLMDTNEDERVIAHELSHHWFGDLLTCESWTQLPLNESFATYSEYLWDEYSLGEDEAQVNLQTTFRGYLNESSQKNVPLIRHHYNLPDEVFDAHSYNKGGLVLHMLRNLIGDEAFFASLKYYLTQNKFKAVEIEHLRLAFEAVTGRDLKWFFEQWFERKGHPKLLVETTYSTDKSMVQVYVHQTQDLKEYQVYYLPLRVDVYTEDGVVAHQIVVDKSEQVFEFPSAKAPKTVIFDAAHCLVGEITQQKTAEELSYQYYNCPHFLDKIEASEKLPALDDNLAQKVFGNMRHSNFWYYRFMGLLSNETMVLSSANVEILKHIALTDPVSKVRAAALQQFDKYTEPDSLASLCQEIASKDSSLMVTESVINLSQKMSKPYMLDIVSRFENDSEVSPYLCTLYKTIDDTTKTIFFQKAFKIAQGYSKWQVLENYTTYLTQFDANYILSKLPIISDIAHAHEFWWLRGGATESLVTLYLFSIEKAKTDTSQAASWNSLRNAVKAQLISVFNTVENPSLKIWYKKLKTRTGPLQ